MGWASADQGVLDGQSREPGKIPIGSPQFPDAVKMAQRGHPGVMDLGAGDPAFLQGGAERWPVTLRSASSIRLGDSSQASTWSTALSSDVGGA